MVFKVPDAYLEEYAARLCELFDLKVTKGQLSKFLASKGITRKKVPNSTCCANRSSKRRPNNEIKS
jgi:hypothetical protein